MRVLLTGANGFVGSHILDELCERGIPTTILLRKTSSTKFISRRLNQARIVCGTLENPQSVEDALDGITHVIHCAGLVRALNKEEFFRVNKGATRCLLDAVNKKQNCIKRFILVSSLAASGPSEPGRPRKEDDAPEPVSAYGMSKLAAEIEVISNCRTEYTILRPPGVYGPRDTEFLRLFKSIQSHLLPKIGSRQELSLVHVKDLAFVCVESMYRENASGKIFFVASPQITTSAALAKIIAEKLKTWTIPLYLPVQALFPVCFLQDIISKITKKPDVLSLDKYNELRASAWTCDVSKLKTELELICKTNLDEGIAQTIEWYKAEGWLK
ncbi:MAG: NAD-dependent epimerase/dehydratase family protein [Verrucomicrobiae bacterium]|nr:NAD-dependent epimerase/dehydratase family protein [Verrucomicrobiae bacterium]